MNCEELLEKLNRYFESEDYPHSPELLYKPIEYALEAGGKRLRPMFVMLSYGLFDNDFDSVLPAAAAVEVFHNFTLLHDDIMDNAPIRRGRPSVVSRWGENVAILSGDAMMIRSYRLLENVPARLLPKVLSCFNRVAIEVCEGQQYDMDFEARQTVSEADYINMIRLKTSVLFEGAVEIGALLGGADSRSIELLRRFAVEFGLAFQLQDDLLDTYGDSRLGKSVGGDILEGKKTFLMITALNSADEASRKQLLGIHSDRTLSAAEKIDRTLEFYERYKVRERTENEINRRFGTALSALGELQCSAEALDILRQEVTALIRRNR